METGDDSEGVGLTAGEPLAIAVDSIRTLAARVRLSLNERLETETGDISADPARKLQTSKHSETGFAIITVTCDVLYVLPILEAVESVLADGSFDPALGILFDYRPVGLHRGIMATFLRRLVDAVCSPTGLNSRCAVLLDAHTDLAAHPVSRYASEAYGHSDNFRLFNDEQQAAEWLVPGHYRQPIEKR
jgi:hypothetical protein